MTSPHDWMKDPLCPFHTPTWMNVNKDVVVTMTKCENCGGTLIRHADKWWELISWEITQSTWRTHSPSRCQARRAHAHKPEGR